MDNTNNEQNTDGQQQTGIVAVKAYIKENKISTCLWITRFLTIWFCLNYMIPIFGNPYNMYQKALLSSAATSALRLHQRVPNVEFTTRFFAQLMCEDSAHYLIYSLMFMYAGPIGFVLISIFLFALIYFASFSLTILNLMGQNNALFSRYLIDLIEFQHRNMLRFASMAEIVVMPVTITAAFSGFASIFTPFCYFQFLKMRYASRRNPYTRNTFYELRVRLETFARDRLPSGLKNVIFKITSFISTLAPPIPQASQTN